MKKKKKIKKGGIESYYDENKPDSSRRTNSGWYEIRKLKKGFELSIHLERGIDKKLFFDDKKALDEYVKKL